MKYSHLQIRRLKREGLTYEQIRERTGCCNETIRRAWANDIDGFRAKEAERQKKFRRRLRNGKNLCDVATIGRTTTSAQDK